MTCVNEVGDVSEGMAQLEDFSWSYNVEIVELGHPAIGQQYIRDENNEQVANPDYVPASLVRGTWGFLTRIYSLTRTWKVPSLTAKSLFLAKMSAYTGDRWLMNPTASDVVYSGNWLQESVQMEDGKTGQTTITETFSLTESLAGVSTIISL